MSSHEPTTYADAGVDIAAGNELVDRIKHLPKSKRTEILSGVGGFAALFELPLERYEQPVMVSATDGVGTKLRLALQTGILEHIGQDLVAMCINDLIVTGGEPLFFLDYYACDKLDVDMAATVVESIHRACEKVGCSLIGGETAEMPGFYATGDFDMAGFAVGVVEKSRIVRGTSVQPNDVLIALPSSGPHANGFSLIRHVLDKTNADLDEIIDGKSLKDWLLEPTALYVDPILALHNAGHLLAAAHITGGGLVENVPRTLPKNVKAIINPNTWQIPALFSWIQEKGGVAWGEMLRTFNCGVGMVVCVPDDSVDEALALLKHTGHPGWCIGYIAEHTGQPIVEMA